MFINHLKNIKSRRIKFLQMKKFLAALIFILAQLSVLAQNEFIKPGTVTLLDFEDLNLSKYSDDNAVIINNQATIGYEFLGDNVNMVVNKLIRAKINKKSGLDIANLTINIPTTAKIANIQGTTYKVENGFVTKINFSKKDLITYKRNDYQNTVIIRLPGVTVGSIVEIAYTVTTPNFRYYKWFFQEDYPVIKSDIQIAIPAIMIFRNILNNIEFNGGNNVYTESIENVNFYGSSNGKVIRYTAKHIPPFKPDVYASASSNWKSSLEMEFLQANIPGYDLPGSSYLDLNKKLLASDEFYKQVSELTVINDILRQIIKNINEPELKIAAIKNWIAKNISWNGDYGVIINTPLRKVFIEKTGSVAEINLILVSMLKLAGLRADPVILSTRDNGLLPLQYPTILDFDYVVAHIMLNGKSVFVDATDKNLPYNVLPTECVNTTGWIVSEVAPLLVNVTNNEIFTKKSAIKLELNPDNSLKGSFTNYFNTYSAVNYRRAMEIGMLNEKYEELAIENADLEISDYTIDTNDINSDLVTESFNANVLGQVHAADSLVYLNPIIFKAISKNPFTALERNYPIDFNYPREFVYSVKIKIPENYKVVEIPDSKNILLPDDGGVFTYTILSNGPEIVLVIRYKLSKTLFEKDFYNRFKLAYEQIINVQKGIVVLKKVTL